MNAQTLETVSNIGEIFAAAMVVVSLIYVGLQVRQNTDVMRIGAAQDYVSSFHDIISIIVQTPDLASVWRRGLETIDTLDNYEEVQFLATMSMITRATQSSHYQWRNGALADGLWLGYSTLYSDLLVAQGAKQFWRMRRHWFSPEFQDWVENVAMKADGNPFYPAMSAEA